MIVTLLALGLLFVPSSHAFFRLGCNKPVLNARVDPIVNFGKASPHAHSIAGSNGVSFSTTFEDLRNSNCTTCKVKDDKSLYWFPELFYHDPSGTFTAVPHGGVLVYYLQRGGSNETVKAFPDGLRMVTGDPYVRNYTGSDEAKALSWLCLDYSKPYQPQTPGITNTVCPNGLRAQVFFPGCWDGKNLDSPDHKSHMRYPDRVDNGVCPASHPVHLVSIFFEVWFYVDTFNKLNNGGQFVLSNGDTTGHALHADFIDGWDMSVLQRAVDQCTADSGVIEDCPVFQNENRFNSDDEMNSCTAPNPLPNEDVIGPIPYLPGCVAITSGPAPATPADLDPNCLAANGIQLNNTLLPNTSSSSIPVSSTLASPLPSTMPASSDGSVPSSSPASPLPSTTPASGDGSVPSSSPAMPPLGTMPASGNDPVPSSSPASPLPSTTPASGDGSVPNSSPAMPLPSTMPASGNDSVPTSSLSTVLPTQVLARPPLSSSSPAPPSVSPPNPMMSSSPEPPDSCDDENSSSPSPSPTLSFIPGSMDPGAILPTTSMTKPSGMPEPSGYGQNGTQYNGTQYNGTQYNGTQYNGTQYNGTQYNGTQYNGTNNQQGEEDYCAGRPSASNKTSRAVSRSAHSRHHARRAGHGTNMGL